MISQKVLAVGSAFAMIPSLVLAQTEATEDQRTEEERRLAIEASQIANEKAQAEADKARIDAEQAAQDLAQDRFSGLDNLTGGSATLGDGAGTMEMSGLVSLMIARAGAAIHDDVGQVRSGSTAGADTSSNVQGNLRDILILPAGSTYSFDTYEALKQNLAAFEIQFKALNLGDDCAARRISEIETETNQGTTEAVIAAAGVANLLAGLAKTNTELRGASFDPADTLLIASIASQNGGRYIDPTSLLTIPTAEDSAGDGVKDKIEQLGGCVLVARAKLASLSMQLAGAIKDSPEAKRLAESIARHKQTIDAAQGFLITYMIGTEGKPPLLPTAIREAHLQSSQPYILRVDIALAHGSLLTRSNLFTAIGARANAVSGGVTVSYQLTDPQTGKIMKSGLVVCSTGLLGLRAAQDVGTVASSIAEQSSCALSSEISAGNKDGDDQQDQERPVAQ